MTTTSRGGALRKTVLTALAAALAVPFGALTATAAPSEPGSVTDKPAYVEPGPGYDGVIEGRSAGTDIIKFGKNAKTLNVYCIEYGVPNATSGTYDPISWSETNIPNLGKVAGIAANSAGIGKPMKDKKAEAVATQLAIWSFTDGVDVTTVPNPSIVDRAQEIIKGARESIELPTPVTTVNATIDAVETPEGTTDFTLTLTDGNGDAAADLNYTLKLDGKTKEYRTGDDGTTTFERKGNFDGKTAVITPEIALPSGTIIDPGNGKQLMMVAHAAEFKDVMGDIKLNVDVTALPKPKPEETPKDNSSKKEKPAPKKEKEETPAPAAANDEKPEELPETGTWVTPSLFAALAALAVAGGFTYWKLRPENQ